MPEEVLEVKEESKEELSPDDIFDKAFDEIAAKEVVEESLIPPEDPPIDEKKEDEALKEEPKIQEGDTGVPPTEEQVQPPVEERKVEILRQSHQRKRQRPLRGHPEKNTLNHHRNGKRNHPPITAFYLKTLRGTSQTTP